MMKSPPRVEKTAPPRIKEERYTRSRRLAHQLPARGRVGHTVLTDATLASELFQMRLHRVGGSRVERRGHVDVDPCDERGDRGRTVAEGFEDLALAHHPMLDVLREPARA